MTKKKKQLKTDGQDLRNVGIYAAAAAGKTQSEIANEFNLSRQRVNAILKSDEAKKLVDQGRSRLVECIELAIDTVMDAMQARADNMPAALKAADMVLKGTGTLTEKVDVNITKPFIYEGPDGQQIIMGQREVSEGEE